MFSERKSATECIETISETLQTQRLVENILKARSDIPPNLEADIRTTELPKMQMTKQNIQDQAQPPCPMNVPVSECCQRSESCELKRPTQFTPNTVECKLSNKIENKVPLKWESPLTQAIRTTEPDPDTFAAIPTKHSHSALATALVIAPDQPFTPTLTSTEPVPLPEETVPYFPPERPVLPPKEGETQKKSKSDKPKSQFVKALEVIPEPRCATPVRGVPPPAKNKPKDPMDKYFEDLPKPQQKLSFLTALTTAPDRPYSPLIETVQGEMKESKDSDKKQTQNIDRSHLTKPKKPEVLPQSFTMNKKDPKPPGYYPPQMMYQRTEEIKSEEHTEETNTSKTTTIEKQTIQNPQVTQIVLEEQNQNVSQNYPPLFQGFSCSFQNKTDHSQFSVEINTSPPLITSPPKAPTPVIKTIETPGYIQKETVTEETHERQQTKKKHEQSKEELKTTAKQSEEVVIKKAYQPVALHKPEGLPQYQVQLEAEAEADLRLLERKQKSQEQMNKQNLKLQEQNLSEQTTISHAENIQAKAEQNIQQKTQEKIESVRKPVIKVESEDDQTQRFFRPVIDERPPNRTFSPRPGTITPSMINKPPSILPYYQANLVAHKLAAPEVNVFDPKSPVVSRSPSPCPGMRRERSPSPFPTGESIRNVSPAPGPPPNPLESQHPLPTPRDTKVEQARESLTTFIPEYKSKMDLRETKQASEMFTSFETVQQQQNPNQYQNLTEKQESNQLPRQMYSSAVQTRNYPTQLQGSTSHEVASRQQIAGTQQTFESSLLETKGIEKSQQYSSKTKEGTIFTSIDEQTKQAHIEQMKQSHNEHVERSADGLTQIQRKKLVTEEYERTQKETNIQIEKNITTSKGDSFKRVNIPAEQNPSVVGMHITNPQPIYSPFLKQTNQKVLQQKQEYQQSQQEIKQRNQLIQQQSCQKEYQQQKDCKETCEKISSLQQDCQNVCTGTPSLAINQYKTTASANASFNTATAPVKHVFAPSSIAPIKHVDPPGSSKKSSQNIIKPNVSQPNLGVGGGRQSGGISVAPRRGRGVLNTAAIGGARIPLCASCNMHIR